MSAREKTPESKGRSRRAAPSRDGAAAERDDAPAAAERDDAPAAEGSDPRRTSAAPPSAATSDSAAPVRRPVWGSIDLLLGLGLAATAWLVLPARWLPVDLGASIFGAALAVSGVGLLLGAPWARVVALATSAATLVVGLALATGLALTAAYLSGIYGPVGKGGALILSFVGILVIPYLVVFPAAQVVALRSRPKTTSSKG